jgi:DNA polymerase elongation subunit (family B)
MARKTSRLAKAAITLAAGTLVEKGIEKAAKAIEARRARRKGSAVAKVVRKKAEETAKSAGKRVSKLKAAAEKKVPAVRKKAARQLEKLAKITAP